MISAAGMATALRGIGIGRGDVVFVHADLKNFGLTRDERGRAALALDPEAALQGFLEVVGPGGTIVVPAFSYSWPKPGFFSVQETPSKMGAFSEAVRISPGARRSLHPLLSLAALGRQAGEILTDVDLTGFGEGSPYPRLHELDARLVMLGVPFCSFKDHVELACQVPYRYTKHFTGMIDTGNGKEQRWCTHSVRYLSQNLDILPLYDGLSEDERRGWRQTSLGAGQIRSASCRDIFKIVHDKLCRDPYAFIPYQPALRLAIDRLSRALRDRLDAPVLSAFAWNEGETERWTWSVSGEIPPSLLTELNRKTVKEKSWWSTLVPADADFVLVMKNAGIEDCLKLVDQIPESHSKDFKTKLLEGILSIC